MQKRLKITIAILVTLCLTACGNNNSKTMQSSSSKVSTSQKVSESSQSSDNNSDLSSENSSTNENQGNNKQQARIKGSNNTQRMAQIAGAIRYFLGKDTLVPTKIDFNKEVVNAYYTGDSNNFTVYYSKDSKNKNFNDPSLSNQIPYVTFSKKTYASKAEASQAINYISGEAEIGLPKIALGGNINATLNSGAGQKYLHWNFGKWSMTVHGSSITNQDPIPVGKKITEMLNKIYLPAPDSKGAGNFTTDSSVGNQILEWNQGNAVYTIKSAHTNALIILAGSIR